MANTIKIKTGKKSYKIKNCNTFLSSAWGLTLDPLTNRDGALIYGNYIGNFLCRRLDLYFLDKNFRVIEKKATRHFLDPRSWSGYRNKKAKYCLEIKNGISSVKTGTKIKELKHSVE